MGKDIIAIDDLAVAHQDGPVYIRIRTLQYTTMLQLFSEIMEDYNASLLKYHDKCLLLLQQQRSLRAYSQKILFARFIPLNIYTHTFVFINIFINIINISINS